MLNVKREALGVSC